MEKKKKYFTGQPTVHERPLPPSAGVKMSELSHLESEGCRNLFGMLDNDEIMALWDTITTT
jgi:hypothetical protein